MFYNFLHCVRIGEICMLDDRASYSVKKALGIFGREATRGAVYEGAKRIVEDCMKDRELYMRLKLTGAYSLAKRLISAYETGKSMVWDDFVIHKGRETFRLGEKCKELQELLEF